MNTCLTIETDTAATTQQVAEAVGAQLQAGDVVLLNGALGAGKTTFTQGLSRALNVSGNVASPTFVIARVHPALSDGPSLVHVDAYRLDAAFDVDDLDLEMELDDAVTVIEWGAGLVESLSPSRLEIDLFRAEAAGPECDGLGDADFGDEPRTLRLSCVGPRWDTVKVEQLSAALGAVGGEKVSGECA